MLSLRPTAREYSSAARLGVQFLDDAVLGVGLGHHHLGRGRLEMIALEGAERQPGPDQDQDGGIAMGLAVMEHPGLLEPQPVAGGAADHRDVAERGVDRRHDGLLTLAHAIDEEQSEGLVGVVAMLGALREFVLQLGADRAAVVDPERRDVEQRPGRDDEIGRVESHRDHAVLVPAARGQLAGRGAAEDRNVGHPLRQFGDERLRIVERRHEHHEHGELGRRQLARDLVGRLLRPVGLCLHHDNAVGGAAVLLRQTYPP
ncbi:hypothetical protein ACVMB0_001311 [Bradyrhizobium sp. USDA 4451]